MQDMQPDNLEMPANDMAQEPQGLQAPEDHEGAMAKADLYKLANYSFKLFKKIQPEDQLEGWVQAKITKAADYIASVYHYLEYEMKFNEYGKALDNSDVMSESQKAALTNMLMEAKAKMKELKKEQAEKIKESEMTKVGDTKKTRTGVMTKTATGVKHTNTSHSDEEHGEPASKVKSRSAAEKAGDKAADKAQEKESKAYEKKHPGTVKRYKDGKEVAEGFEAGAKTGSTFKTKTGVATKTATGLKHTNTSHSDEEHGEPVSKVKSRSAAEKAGDKAADKAQEKDYKAAKKANPEGVRRYSLGKQVDEAKEKEPEGTYSKKRFETDGQRVARLAKEKMQAKKKAEAEKVDEGSKPDFLDMDKDGDKKEPMKKAVADKKKNPFAKKVDEGKPSAGLSKDKKSDVVKDAKAGKDIGKPGKSFDKVAKSAGGGEKGKKIAAAAMWKNIKEGVKIAEAEKKAKKDYDGDGEVESGKDEHAGSVDKAIKASKTKEVVKESADLTRMKEFLTRLNG